MVTDKLKKNIEKALFSLGGSHEKVAKTLHKKGYKGKRDKPRSCPVARYLEDTVKCPLQVMGARIDLHSHILRLPIPVSEFVQRFDNGEYPELETNNKE